MNYGVSKSRSLFIKQPVYLAPCLLIANNVVNPVLFKN